MKKLLTFLGVGPYKETEYYQDDKVIKTNFIQEAIYNIIGGDAEVILFLTKKAKKENWLGEGKDYKGLKQRFDEGKIKYNVIDIQDGENDQENWHNFDKIYNSIEEEDEIYVDITHSFRSLPIIFMAVLNYAKFIKNVDIKAIYYGAYEAKKNNKAPIFNLTIFMNLSDWTVQAEKLITTGDGAGFSQLASKTLEPMLKEAKGKSIALNTTRNLNEKLREFSFDLKASRGNKISESGCKLKSTLLDLQEIEIDELKPFEKIIDKVLRKVEGYSGDIIKDIHHTICLCRDFKLIQQAYTLLTENIVTYLCIKVGLDINNKRDREEISQIITNQASQNKKKGKFYHNGKEIDLALKEKTILYMDNELVNLYDQLSDFRNDINHGGYRQNAKAYEKFEKRLNELILKAEELLNIKKEPKA